MNHGIISVPLPRTQFLFIHGFIYLSTSWKTDGSNRQLEPPEPHPADLGCTTNSSANPSSTWNPELSSQLELLASHWAAPTGSPSSSCGPGTANSPTVPEVLWHTPHCYPSFTEAGMGPAIFLGEAMDTGVPSCVSNNSYMSQAAWRQICLWHGWQLSLRHNSEAALWSMAVGCKPSFLAVMVCAGLCMCVREQNRLRP